MNIGTLAAWITLVIPVVSITRWLWSRFRPRMLRWFARVKIEIDDLCEDIRREKNDPNK